MESPLKNDCKNILTSAPRRVTRYFHSHTIKVSICALMLVWEFSIFEYYSESILTSFSASHFDRGKGRNHTADFDLLQPNLF